jgi:hypothetical protein
MGFFPGIGPAQARRRDLVELQALRADRDVEQRQRPAGFILGARQKGIQRLDRFGMVLSQ